MIFTIRLLSMEHSPSPSGDLGLGLDNIRKAKKEELDVEKGPETFPVLQLFPKTVMTCLSPL